jgi:hypothetical protein
MRYKLYQTGPDNHSTYAECWGSGAKSNGRLVAEADTLAGLIRATDMGHSNWTIRDTHRREWISPSEFRLRKCVCKAIPEREA